MLRTFTLAFGLRNRQVGEEANPELCYIPEVVIQCQQSKIHIPFFLFVLKIISSEYLQISVHYRHSYSFHLIYQIQGDSKSLL